ncbi:MAG: cytochrome c, partial [Myxococcales bacterium]|nr:cytochrome c [Myxococcales bacterium]
TAATPAAPAPTDDAYDTRTPVPMPPMMAAHHKQQMRDHLLAIQEITAALATDDFAAVEASAGRIAWSEEQAMMCQHMGAGTPGFGDLGEAFHHTADGIVTAARDRDRAGVLTALGATLQTCTGCHETYRQVVVADGGGMPGAGMPGAGGPGPMPGMHGGGAPGAMHGR